MDGKTLIILAAIAGVGVVLYLGVRGAGQDVRQAVSGGTTIKHELSGGSGSVSGIIQGGIGLATSIFNSIGDKRETTGPGLMK